MKTTIDNIKALKGRRKITMLTAYDYPMASLIDESGIDIILVGDSVANVVLGLDATTQVGMSEMLHHSKAAARAVTRGLLVGDMPFEAYQKDPGLTADNGRRFIGEGGCDAVKIEWFDRCAEAAGKLVEADIPVMGHIGLTPQTAEKLGGFKVQGKDFTSASALIAQARLLEKTGCFAIVLECVPDRIAALITGALHIPTIGIGAGPHCDGQVLVAHDILGLFNRFKPRFVKRYADMSAVITKAVNEYKKDVENGVFPASEHTFSINDDEYQRVLKENPVS